MSKKVEFNIIPERIPPSVREKTSLYSDIIKAVLQKGKGSYRIDLPNKKPKTLYQTLASKIRNSKQKNLKVYIRGNNVYIEVL
jgi:hypothetical protein